ncbi:hypothetical protein Syun_006543 [Stephania yunnanensis]|uniref:Uncharacterized protein n=1 Tax=Stephania yunnanensis TaxID=152371 RepID=A0AAP0KYG4_9MAGN
MATDKDFRHNSVLKAAKPCTLTECLAVICSPVAAALTPAHPTDCLASASSSSSSSTSRCTSRISRRHLLLHHRHITHPVVPAPSPLRPQSQLLRFGSRFLLFAN